MYRLILPQVIWTFIYFIWLMIVSVITKSFDYGVKDFLIQLFLGHAFNFAMWFTINLIWITALFSLMSKNKKFIYLLSILSMGCLIFEYLGIKLPLFGVDHQISFPIESVFCMIPAATFGVILHYFNLLERFKKRRGYWLTLFAMLFVVFILLDSRYNDNVYWGLTPLIASFCLVCIFYVLPLENVPYFFKSILKFISKYTMGIYASHILIGAHLLWTIFYVVFHFDFSDLPDTLECVIVFMSSFIFSWLISLIPFKWCKQIVT